MTRAFLRIRGALAFALLGLLSACNRTGACPDIDCHSSVAIVIEGVEEVAVAVEFETSNGTFTCERVQAAGGESASVGFECPYPDAISHGEGHFVLYETPQEVTVRVVPAVGSPQSETFRPTYKPFDESCNQDCMQADLEMTLE